MNRAKFIQKAENYFYGTYHKNARPDYYEIRWVVSGASGGNCWGDEAEYFWEGDPEPRFDYEALPYFFKTIFKKNPEIDYSKLDSLAKYDEYTEDEYYGNYNNFKCKRITFNDLYDFLVKEGHLYE